MAAAGELSSALGSRAALSHEEESTSSAKDGIGAWGSGRTSPSASSCLRRSIILSPRLLYSLAICCAKAAVRSGAWGSRQKHARDAQLGSACMKNLRQLALSDPPASGWGPPLQACRSFYGAEALAASRNILSAQKMRVGLPAHTCCIGIRRQAQLLSQPILQPSPRAPHDATSRGCSREDQPGCKNNVTRFSWSPWFGLDSGAAAVRLPRGRGQERPCPAGVGAGSWGQLPGRPGAGRCPASPPGLEPSASPSSASRARLSSEMSSGRSSSLMPSVRGTGGERE